MLWIALAFAAYSLFVTGLYFRECDRHDATRSQLDDTDPTPAHRIERPALEIVEGL